MRCPCQCNLWPRQMRHLRALRRDLKLDNTLLDEQSPPVLKLCDVRTTSVSIKPLKFTLLSCTAPWRAKKGSSKCSLLP